MFIIQQSAFWDLVEEEIKKMLRQLVTSDEYVSWFTPDDIHFIVTANNDSSSSPLGLIHYVISPKIAENEAKICTLGVAPPMQQLGLGKLLVSSIFKIMPNIKRLFLLTRITNHQAQNMYNALRFTQFPSEFANWVNLEYLTDRERKLQEYAEKLLCI